MGFFTKIEKLSEKYIEGFFKNKFPNHIQPAEIAKILLHEMRDCKTVSVSKVYVPNEYKVFLGEEDWQTIDSVRTSLSKELQEFLKQKASEKNYEFVGEVRVLFELDKEVALGTLSIESSFSEEPPGNTEPDDHAGQEIKQAGYTIIADKDNFYKNAPDLLSQDTLTRMNPADKQPKAVLIQKFGTREGVKFPLGSHGVIIGRRRTNEICLEDTNISRVHASVDYLDGSYYIADLGSTNGTYVNGVMISKKKLNEGDLIKVGTTVLEFRVV